MKGSHRLVLKSFRSSLFIFGDEISVSVLNIGLETDGVGRLRPATGLSIHGVTPRSIENREINRTDEQWFNPSLSAGVVWFFPTMRFLGMTKTKVKVGLCRIIDFTISLTNSCPV